MSKPEGPEETGRLARRLSTTDAVTIGLGSMIGAGVFAAVGPAADAAGTWLLVGLGVAALVAFANALSSAQLAAIYPESGGTYVYARERLGSYWGFLAGWGFVIGKSASLSVMALTFGFYVYPALARPLALIAVIGFTLVNYRGVEKTARLTKILVALVLVALVVVVGAALGGGQATVANLSDELPGGLLGIARAAGLLFFAFAGYARIATLGEEVRDPQHTIPRAIPIALGVVVLVYAAVMASALLAVGPENLAAAPAPLAKAVEAGRWSGVNSVVRIGAAVASLGVLLSLLAGVSRTILAMARRRELPGWFAAVHRVHRTPHRAEFAVGLIVCVVVLVGDLRSAIGFSSFAVLTYYALTNASAHTLQDDQRKWPRWISSAGLGGCVVLAFSLPVNAVVGGIVVLAIGSLAWQSARSLRVKKSAR